MQKPSEIITPSGAPVAVPKRVYTFTDAYLAFKGQDTQLTAAARERMRSMLGGKGAGLAEMVASGVSVPPGITITTDNCRDYYKLGGNLPAGLFDEVLQELVSVETALGRVLGDVEKPLLLSVRSGAKFSMPGMMDTILNLGLNPQTVAALAKLTGNDRFAWDSYRRFIQMYGNVVLDIPKEKFEHILSQTKTAAGVKVDNQLSALQLMALVARYKDLVLAQSGKPFPDDTKEQLAGAIEAVFRSWNNDRAIWYRNYHQISHDIGTAVTVQSMVFGNLDDKSATGVCFTRNPSTGFKSLFGEYLVNAQGEDVVAGIRTPANIEAMAAEMPEVHGELLATVARLEKHYRDVQDIEFTVESGKLYILQTRTGKRNAEAAVKIAVDMVDEALINRQEALLRVEPLSLNQVLLPSFVSSELENARQSGKLIARGLDASPGAAIGEIVFDTDEAERRGKNGEKVILVRVETCPDDMHGIVAAQAVVTSRGGKTSHAAVVARGMGKPCVAGCEALNIDQERGLIKVGTRTFKKGEIISVDGSTGEIFEGAIATRGASLTEELRRLLGWADEVRTMGVRANADTPLDARVARDFGAQGIGLCRTEHMFMSPERLPVVQSMILAGSLAEREVALAKLLPMQREDFIGLFEAMAGLPVTIRLLDPPLHEFLPKLEELIAEVATIKGRVGRNQLPGRRKRDEKLLAEKQALLATVQGLHESNPMMGLRGCRLGLVYPEINVMQVRAIFEAAVAVTARGIAVEPEIMIPLVGHVEELKAAREVLEKVALAVMEEAGRQVPYKFGTMIEVPRAALTAEEIAEHAEFFSFGTNDLTQMTFGFSRDDAEGKFLQHYLEGVDVNGKKRQILEQNPFASLDQKGVGKLMSLAVADGKRSRPGIKLGICGEHGGDPASIAFANSLGLTYVSCSPYRVPIARLAAAQAAIQAAVQTTVVRDR